MLRIGSLDTELATRLALKQNAMTKSSSDAQLYPRHPHQLDIKAQNYRLQPLLALRFLQFFQTKRLAVELPKRISH